jgi:hypothetical protein
MSAAPKALLLTDCNQTATTLGLAHFEEASRGGKSYIE